LAKNIRRRAHAQIVTAALSRIPPKPGKIARLEIVTFVYTTHTTAQQANFASRALATL
jgi:hypothetical protein